MNRPKPLTGKRILVIEDDYYLASDEKALLEQAGAEVVGPFGNGCTEQELAEAGRIDAAVVDINLGTGPSFGFARMLGDRGIPFAFVTGYDQAAIPPELAHAPRLEKPIRDRELVATAAKLAGA